MPTSVSRYRGQRRQNEHACQDQIGGGNEREATQAAQRRDRRRRPTTAARLESSRNRCAGAHRDERRRYRTRSPSNEQPQDNDDGSMVHSGNVYRLSDTLSAFHASNCASEALERLASKVLSIQCRDYGTTNWISSTGFGGRRPLGWRRRHDSNRSTRGSCAAPVDVREWQARIAPPFRALSSMTTRLSEPQSLYR